jgi:coproporphyrinogen III oxidase-like Fe-S oxidoreductase
VQFAQLLALQELPVSFQQKLIEFSANNWLLQTDSGIVLTEQGRLMADHIAAELFL